VSRALWPTLTLTLLLLARPFASAEEVGEDERTVRQAGVNPDGASLLEQFRKHIPAADDLEKAREHVRKLASEDFAEREQASAALVTLGPPGRAILRAALADPDIEVAHRAGVCLDQIATSHDPILLEACARLLAQKPPPGAVTVLLDFAAFAEDPALIDELAVTLTRLGVRAGEAHPALLAALADPSVVKRALAGEALVRGGAVAQRGAVYRLLQDPDSTVRERIALALLDARDRQAVPALIRLVGEMSRTRRWPIEEALTRVAGDQAPPGTGSEDENDQRERRAAWEAWWRQHGATLDLTTFDPTRPLGYTLVTVMDPRGGGRRMNGRVMELDAAGQVRWQMATLRNPVDAQVLGPDRVLISESVTRQVTVRNFKGEIFWVYEAPGILVSARRLRNGQTVVVTRDDVIDLDRDGKEVSRIPCPNNGTIAAAVRLPNRQTALVTITGEFHLLDARGQSVRSIDLNARIYSSACGIDVLPNGHLLLPLYSAGEVIEVDTTGKIVWKADVATPTSVQRLPNGNTLVASLIGQDVLEIDKDGKIVAELTTGARPQRASRR
jgi:hypothetical protein